MTHTDPETARALLYRHGLPEDVIDGALCLHAQELAAVQRRDAAVWGVDTAAGKRILAAADLIDPTKTPAASSAGVSPAPDQTALRYRIAETLAEADGWRWAPGFKAQSPTWQGYQARADAVVAVLPASVDRADVLREEAALIRAHCPDHLDADSAEGSWMDCHCAVADDMERRVAAETHNTTGHACSNCEGIDPDTCLMNPDRPKPSPNELAVARETNRRLNRRAQELESELAAYRRAVSQWEVSERGTYIPHASLRAIGLASGKDILGSVRHLKHFERVEQAEATIERVRRLHDSLSAETGLTSPDDPITREAAAERIAAALDGRTAATAAVGVGAAAEPADETRGELKPWQLLRDVPDEPLPQTEQLVGGRRLPRGETIHGCPPDGSGLTPCCGRTPFELPLTDRISSEAPITCTGPATPPAGGAPQPKEAQ